MLIDDEPERESVRKHSRLILLTGVCLTSAGGIALRSALSQDAFTAWRIGLLVTGTVGVVLIMWAVIAILRR